MSSVYSALLFANGAIYLIHLSMNKLRTNTIGKKDIFSRFYAHI